MPTPKRWHPVSRELNDDPEVWELTDTFGDRALRIHLEVFANIDRTENAWPLTGHWLAGLSRKVRQQPATVRRVLDWMLKKAWLTSEQSTENGYLMILSANNYWKYHKRREPRGAVLSPNNENKRSRYSPPPFPILSDPNLRKERIRSGGPGETGDKPPVAEDRSVCRVGDQDKDRMSSIGETLQHLSPALRETLEQNLRETES